jgi:hypothetical protein
MDGNARWSCSQHKADISVATQRTGCDSHRYIPILLTKFAKPVDMMDDAVVYEMDGKRFFNGTPATSPKHISSAEIHACNDKTVLVDDAALDLRLQHGGRFV